MGQLYHLPTIIGSLGISVANAQKELNADYIESVKKLMGLIERTIGHEVPDESEDAKAERAKKAQAVQQLLESLAPSRYQFTETTLDFSADLAETTDVAVSAGAGFGFHAVTVNAAFSLGYGYDYRAAARVTTKLHALPVGEKMGPALLSRAADIDKAKLSLPQLSKVEKDIWDQTAHIYNALTGAEVQPVKQEDPGAD